jgi:hypothetical protein
MGQPMKVCIASTETDSLVQPAIDDEKAFKKMYSNI